MPFISYNTCWGLSEWNWRNRKNTYIFVQHLLRFIFLFGRLDKYQLGNFRTTLVEVYLNEIEGTGRIPIFSYNTCWGLSKWSSLLKIWLCRFSYNTCWGLSPPYFYIKEMFFNFRTTLVEVYLKKIIDEKKQNGSFRTIFVKVYRRWTSFCM